MANVKNTKEKNIKAQDRAEREDVGQTSGTAQMPLRRERTRSSIALVYVVAYLVIIAGALMFGIYKGYSINDQKDILLAISGVLSGSLGFIIGYYFKASGE